MEAFLSSDLLQYADFSNTFLFLASNSGKTKEVLLLLEHAKKHGAACIGITANVDSPLAQQCHETIFLTSQFEKGIAATKSVIEQALIYDSLIFHLAELQKKSVDFQQIKRDLKDTGEKIAQNAELLIDVKLLSVIAESPCYFFAGLETGVAEELALKMLELVRKPAVFYPDTLILHGPAEAIDQGTVVIVDPNQFELFASNFKEFSKKTSTRIIGLGNGDISLAINKIFQNYCLLAGGWGLLRNIANYLHIDVDSPQKISKVGVPFET